VTLFPEAYNRFAPLTREAGPFIIEGKVEEQFGIYSLTADTLITVHEKLRQAVLTTTR
jgi:hypothetical protein